MAIDGVEIIDSDLAHDVYNLIMEMYHSGESAYSIRNKMNEFHAASCEMDYEIITAAYALAMWEIGELTTEQLQNMRDIVTKGASSQWNDIYSEAQKERQKVLNKFLQKIEQPNLKIKKRKRYEKLISLFSEGEVLAFKINHCYRCIIFERFYQYRQDAYYSFVATTYNSNVEPTIENILLEEIPVAKRANTGEYGIRTLDIPYKFMEKHKSHFLKLAILNLDKKAANSGFSRLLSGLDNLQDMEQEMNDILLGEKVGLYVCCLF